MSRAACTIVTKSHIAFARALALQLREHNPDIKLYVLLADTLDREIDPGAEPFHLIRLADLAFQNNVREMTDYYSAFELCTALRPYLHQYLLSSTKLQSWIFLDSDIYVLNPLDEVFEALQDCQILLSPHSLAPDIDAYPVEHTFLKYGVFNGGFVGLTRGSESERFVHWFRSRLTYYCLEDSHCYVDQAWLNLVPTFFGQARIFTHPGANISFWNLHERNILPDESCGWRVNGKPLLFLHFSGANFEEPEKVFQPNKKFSTQVPDCLRYEFKKYVALLFECGLAETRNFTYGLARDKTGKPLPKERRREIREACLTRHIEEFGTVTPSLTQFRK